ncbi:MAG: hypothetical protein M9891_17635 [Austwickia sp.]|nr:hypothetical protein [Austwickia sp.]MCO5311071.1 hypothetical protein [Austwickia sp.]
MGTGRRGELFAYSAIIAVNLLVLPNWFSPGRFAFGMRLAFIAASAAVIAFCAWRISGILGVNPFSKVKHPRFAPYEPALDDDEDDRPDRESFGDDQSPFGRARRRRQEEARSWGRSEDFREYDPYDEAPEPPDTSRDAADPRLARPERPAGPDPDAPQGTSAPPDPPRG